MIRTLTPGGVLRGEGALDATGVSVAQLGTRPLIVHGEVGFALVADRLRASLAGAVPSVAEVAHAGAVTAEAIDRLAHHALAGGHDVVVGVGGGRVLDAAKGAADRVGAPFVAIPTSPATCAATTALSVLYDDAWVWQAPSPTRACPELVVLDPTILAAAPDRLLAAGVFDALCKVEEVRIATRTVQTSDPWRDAALAVCDALAAWVDPAAGALAAGLPQAPADRTALAEAVVVLPGLIAGLAGEGNKLAAAHAVHNALTRVPDHHRSLHGELIGFSLLVQAVLDGADDAALTARVAWMAGLGLDASLNALGCGGYVEAPEPVLAWLSAAPALRRAFPDTDEDTLARAIERADRAARHRGTGLAPHPNAVPNPFSTI